MEDFLSALPLVASSGYAYIAYILTLIAWFLIALRVRRHSILMKNLRALPSKDRLQAVQMEMGTASVPPDLTPDQWLQSKVNFYYLVAFGIFCAVLVVILSLAYFDPSGEVIGRFGSAE
ncbi:hypothetical protein [Roseobacter litoralis]|uniref:Uncharacterized protein n=1 Tax=Roseobacter litoralis (strain ATCC 49566 / DSM 6996 / JCM 21268 / NBRC 15278 / OCh 149) TaxID=391595 RepID=F7ZBN7_ROSLO|nr:hypothetical protein [Roseobacter litoralis]AEI95619.1 hypothetical protein RLO149_c037030 [Roseobacter litoralis Och 149]